MFTQGFSKLKEHKAEIEHLQHLLEQSRRRLQQDFENWFAKQNPSSTGFQESSGALIPQLGLAGLKERPGSASRKAWASPKGTGVEIAAGQGANKSSVPPSTGSGPMLTGNKEVDAEIMAFYEARESLIKKRMSGTTK